MAAGQGNTSGSFGGPGNKAIATTLLEWLSAQGRLAARDRALRALGPESDDLAAAPSWLADSAIPALFSAGEIEPGLARAVGHRLVSPDVTGLKLYGLVTQTTADVLLVLGLVMVGYLAATQQLLGGQSPLARWRATAFDDLQDVFLL